MNAFKELNLEILLSHWAHDVVVTFNQHRNNVVYPVEIFLPESSYCLTLNDNIHLWSQSRVKGGDDNNRRLRYLNACI